MANIKRINTSQIVGRSPFDEDDEAIMPSGTLVIYQNGDQHVLRMHDGVTNGGNPLGGTTNQLENDGATLTLTDQGALTFNNGGVITETEVTGNPTMVIVPSNPTVESQALLIKGGGSYNAENNGIALNWNIINPQVGDTVNIYVYAPTFANQTLYWWIHPAEANTSDPGTGTISIDEFGYGPGGDGDISFIVDNADYEFTVRVSPTENVYDPEGTGVESLTFNTDQPSLFDHHLHLTTGDLTETSIILGTDDHNVRTTTDGGVEITTPNESNNVWRFGSNGDLELPTNGGIVFDRANTLIRVGQGFHIASGEGISIDAINETDPENLVYKSWSFNTDGNLILPDGGDILMYDGEGYSSVLGGGSTTATRVSITDDNLVLELNDPNDSNIVIRSTVLNSNTAEVASTELGRTNGFVIRTNVIDDAKQWQFNNAGELTFPDATTQDTAWTGIVDWADVQNTPTIPSDVSDLTDTEGLLTGVSSNTGAVTFDDNTIQANPLDTVGTKITVNTNYLGVTSQNSNVFPLSKTADTDQVQIGWIIRGTDGVGQTVTNKADSGGYWSFFVSGGRQTSYPITIESADYSPGAEPILTLSVVPDDAEAVSWTFDANGSITFPDDTVQTTAYVPEDNLVKVSDEWEVTAGANTYSFTVPSDGTYIMWVKGNIPNGIITWNATVSVSNTNVPAIGTQYAWNYTGGGSPILLTSIPDQIKGSAGTISTDATYSGTTSNRFDFGISNTSGSTQTIYYGYTKIS